MSIESENIYEEVKEILEGCIRCGKCNEGCPVFKIVREEPYSPRGFISLFDEKIFDKIVYNCTLCKSCEVKCPLNLKICDAILKARKVLVGLGRDNEKNKEMIKNLVKSGNVYGVV